MRLLEYFKMCYYIKIINFLYSTRIHLPVQEMQETRVQFLGWEDLLEEEMGTHSSVLAWETPWTEEPGGLQSMGVSKSLIQLNNFECSTHSTRLMERKHL